MEVPGHINFLGPESSVISKNHKEVGTKGRKERRQADGAGLECRAGEVTGKGWLI